MTKRSSLFIIPRRQVPVANPADDRFAIGMAKSAFRTEPKVLDLGVWNG